jgi:ML domain
MGPLSFLILASTVALRNCGSSSDQATITSFGFSPENPVAGDQTDLWVAYDLKSDLTGGTATYTVSFNGIPLPATKEDLCSQTACPKAPGSFNETSSSEFPNVSGKIVSKISWTDQNSKPVWCIEATFRTMEMPTGSLTEIPKSKPSPALSWTQKVLRYTSWYTGLTELPQSSPTRTALRNATPKDETSDLRCKYMRSKLGMSWRCM